MKDFALLTEDIAASKSSREKEEVLASYLSQLSLKDAAIAVYLLSGKKQFQVLKPILLQKWACELAGINEWLLHLCQDVVADFSETVALVLPNNEHESQNSLADWFTKILSTL